MWNPNHKYDHDAIRLFTEQTGLRVVPTPPPAPEGGFIEWDVFVFPIQYYPYGYEYEFYVGMSVPGYTKVCQLVCIRFDVSTRVRTYHRDLDGLVKLMNNVRGNTLEGIFGKITKPDDRWEYEADRDWEWVCANPHLEFPDRPTIPPHILAKLHFAWPRRKPFVLTWTHLPDPKCIPAHLFREIVEFL